MRFPRFMRLAIILAQWKLRDFKITRLLINKWYYGKNRANND